MTVDNIQYDRDAHKSSENFSAKREVSKVEDIKSRTKIPLVHFREDNKNSRIAFVDMSALVEKAVNLIMIPNLVIKPRALSTLEQLAIGLDDYKSLQKKKLSEISLFSRTHQVSEWERKMISAATWLNSCEEFRKLNGDVKMNILRGVWMLWGKLERVAMTAQMRRRGECEEKQFVVSSTSMVDFDRVSNDVSWRSNYSYQQLLFLLSPTERYYDSLIREMMEVHPDSTELTFLLCIICFQITGNHFKGETEEVCERLQDIVANDIHDYYEKKEKNNYAFRIQQLMRIKEHFIRLRFQRGEKYKVACQLDFIQLKVSNPEFFRLMC